MFNLDILDAEGLLTENEVAGCDPHMLRDINREFELAAEIEMQFNGGGQPRFEDCKSCVGCPRFDEDCGLDLELDYWEHAIYEHLTKGFQMKFQQFNY